MKIAFREKPLNDGLLALIEQAQEFIDEDDGAKKTARQIYYRFIATDTLPDSWIDRKYNAANGLDPDTKNTPKNYKRLCVALTDARYAGLIDWDAIEDRGREPDQQLEFDSLRHRVDSAIANYRLPRWRNQDYYVELWVEKAALAGTLGDLAKEHHVTLMVNKGYSSASAMFESATRFRDAEDRGKRPVILYVGDHDPSGEDMVRDIEERLREFGTEVDVEKVTLTIEQVRKFRPPPNPAKVTDPRAKDYIEKFGQKSWEVDAIPSRELRRLITAAVKRRITDKADYQLVLDEEDEGKRVLLAAAENIE